MASTLIVRLGSVHLPKGRETNTREKGVATICLQLEGRGLRGLMRARGWVQSNWGFRGGSYSPQDIRWIGRAPGLGSILCSGLARFVCIGALDPVVDG
ncbi:hypothetical protein CRG98_018451 [Punica granatum]|uniref:Uncharacterized protein n=1 Tax=Punica granatum TaxID=22663 RepID=A0A2I0JXW1_PUNGR|nr:hypothetical protein CRG98_018451 [Punica granatum]